MKSKSDYVLWHNSCEFIEDNMKYYSFTDFLDKARIIKVIFNQQNTTTKRMYMWYVFSSNITYNQKLGVWDYLNSYASYEDLILLKSNRDRDKKRIQKTYIVEQRKDIEQRKIYMNYRICQKNSRI